LLLRIVRTALRSMLRRPIRTFLTVQGVLWGTALGISLPAVLSGSRRTAEADAQRLGTDRILIGQLPAPEEHRFDWSLVRDLRRAFSGRVRVITAYTVRYTQLNIGNATHEVPLFLVDEEFFRAHSLTLLNGRFPRPVEIRTGEAVAVVTQGVSPAGKRLAPGTVLTLNGRTKVRVVGVIRPFGMATDQFGYYRRHVFSELVQDAVQVLGIARPPGLGLILRGEGILVPHRLFFSAYPNWIEVRAEPRRVKQLKDELFAWLAERGYEPVVYANVLALVLYSETIERVRELNRVVFALAVTVGAIVVSCLMLLSVWERRREIAIRRVEGARWWHVVAQFVLESATMCFVGGLLGVPTGLGLAELRCRLTPAAGVTWAVPVAEIMITLCAVVIAGVLAGLLPAVHAARVDPVEVLRFE